MLIFGRLKFQLAMPVDKFTLERVVEEEETLLSYVKLVAEEYCPDVGFDSLGQPHALQSVDNATYRFMARYNRDSLGYKHITFEKCLKDREVQGSLVEMGVNIEQFWYLLLFIFDYVENSTWQGLSLSKTAKEELQELVTVLELKSSERANITLKKGSQSLVIENPHTINLITELCKLAIENAEDGSVVESYRFIRQKKTVESVAIGLFAKMFLCFFEKMSGSFKSRRNKGCEFSLSKKLLISRLVYLTKQSTNKGYYVDDDNLKDILKKHKGVNTINSVYLV